MASTEPAAQALIAAEKARLIAKGLPDKLVDSAIRRAEGRAHSMANRLPAERQARAYVDFLEAELQSSEAWVAGVVRSVSE